MGGIGSGPRPRVLRAWTPETEEKFLVALRAGNYIQTACALVGVSRVGLYERLKRGARERRRLEKPRTIPDPKFADDAEFSIKVEQALAIAETKDLHTIGKAADEQWTAAAWRLERRFPDRWGRRDKVTLLQTLAKEIDSLNDDELLALIHGAGDPAEGGPGNGQT